MPPPPRGLRVLAQRQDGVVTTSQCVALGVDPDWVRRQVVLGRWQRIYRGVMVTHSGPVLWRSRACAALLYAGRGAALSHRSAGHLHGIAPVHTSTIHVRIPVDRRVTPTAGLQVRRGLHRAVLVAGLPVVNASDTVLDLLQQVASTDDAVGLLCSAVRAGVWPEEILGALTTRSRFPQRSLVSDLLDAVSAGVESPLELRYHRDVERRHGLPTSELQVRHVLDDRWVRADSVYRGLGVRVELDGALAHPGGRTDADTWRDNAVLIERGEITLRYRWAHVRSAPCRTAAQVAAALSSRGTTVPARPCSATCTVDVRTRPDAGRRAS